jgi:hypothetical protein
MISKSTLKQSAMISSLMFCLMAVGCSASSGARAMDPADPPPAAVKTTASAIPAAAPRVQDCGIVAISSPPKYVCGGKVYTATQLAKIRNDEAKKYQSGK